MALLLAPVELPGMRAHPTYHVVVATGQPKHHGHFPLLSTTESDTNQSSQGRPDDAAMAVTGLLLPTRLNHEGSNFQKSLTFPSVSHYSTTSSNLPPHFMLAEPNQVRNQCLGSIHTFKQRSTTPTASAILYIKTGRNGLMLVKKWTSLSTKPRPIAERIFYIVLCQTLTAQMHGKWFEASTTHQIPTRPLKPCLIMVEQCSSMFSTPQCSICWQRKLHLHQYVRTLISISEDEMQRSCWSRQHFTNIPQITWSFSSPGTALYIQHIQQRIWRVAIIIPLLKPRTLPSDVASFWPISLTSCVVKLLERIIADWLYYIAESNNLFSHFQAGFCRGRSCEDQILWIVQAIEYEFQHRLTQRSVLTLLDFSKAYHTIRQGKLLLCMLEAGVPMTFIHWLCSFLTKRRARVQLHNACSSSRRFNQGLPQGSVLVPLLFLFYINNLVETYWTILLLLCLQTMFPSWQLSAKKKTPLQQLSQKSLKVMNGDKRRNLT